VKFKAVAARHAARPRPGAPVARASLSETSNRRPCRAGARRGSRGCSSPAHGALSSYLRGTILIEEVGQGWSVRRSTDTLRPEPQKTNGLPAQSRDLPAATGRGQLTGADSRGDFGTKPRLNSRKAPSLAKGDCFGPARLGRPGADSDLTRARCTAIQTEP
jgi:hypothetical protein